MLKYCAIAIGLFVTSFFFFPFCFTFLPTVNTKMMVAACGLVTFFVRMGMAKSEGSMNKDFFILSLCALLVSFVGFISMTVNDTPDTSYMTYIISMWVWLGGAYFVIFLIKQIHGRDSVELVCLYLITVCTLQCLLAEAIENIPSVKTFIDSILAGEGFMGKNEDRLYGLGCALDVAGSRFAVVLVMIAFLLPRFAARKEKFTVLYLLFSFGVIAVIGNIIGRTATLGLFIAIGYLVYALCFDRSLQVETKRSLSSFLIGGLFLVTLVFIILYNADAGWQKQLRFGFEGFFSLIETGHWQVTSNHQLTSQVVWPSTLHTWLIGDGYMESTELDPYYVGKDWHGFYMGTDVGYCRFIFYFGITGLLAFSAFMLKVGEVCIRKHKSYWLLFMMMLAINFIVWIKVSTDIFLAFAPFLLLGVDEREVTEEVKNIG